MSARVLSKKKLNVAHEPDERWHQLPLRIDAELWAQLRPARDRGVRIAALVRRLLREYVASEAGS
jgi:hypothetical protein